MTERPYELLSSENDRLSRSRSVLFRGDGDQLIGLGHLYRLLALFDLLRNRFNCALVTRSDVSAIAGLEHHRVIQIPTEISLVDEPTWLTELCSSSECIVVADGYQFTSHYQRALKDQGFTFGNILYVLSFLTVLFTL